jgi:signal recognition particle receptor subunit beta
MVEADSKAREINAKIVYFGPEGSGMTANVQYIHRKLRQEHRGDLRTEQPGDDPSTTYEILPVHLGAVQGYETSIDIHTVPGAPGLNDLRRDILKDADGVVFVADLCPDRHDATVEAVEELRGHIQSYGRSLDDMMLLIQYNKRDLADENALDSLHPRLGLKPAATFEAVASKGTGVLQTLTSVSKLMLSKLRQEAECLGDVLDTPLDQDVSETIDADLTEAEATPEMPDKGFRIEDVGPAEGSEQGIQVPIRLIDEASGRRLELCLRLSIDEA